VLRHAESTGLKLTGTDINERIILKAILEVRCIAVGFLNTVMYLAVHKAGNLLIG
jgi:hypothetical protein